MTSVSSSKRKLTSAWAGNQEWLLTPVPLRRVWSSGMSEDQTKPRRRRWLTLMTSLVATPTALPARDLSTDWTQKTGWRSRQATGSMKEGTSSALIQTWNRQQQPHFTGIYRWAITSFIIEISLTKGKSWLLNCRVSKQKTFISVANSHLSSHCTATQVIVF